MATFKEKMTFINVDEISDEKDLVFYRNVEQDRGVGHDLEVCGEAGEHRERHRLVHQPRALLATIPCAAAAVAAPEVE